MSEDKSEFVAFDLDATLDDIDDLPGFATFPAGAYVLTLDKLESKVVNEHPAVEITEMLVEISELSEPLPEGEAEPKVGDVQTILFMLDNAMGAGLLKQFMKPLAVALDMQGAKLSEIIAAAQGMTIIQVQKRKYDKEKDRFYPTIKQTAVV